MQQHDEKPQAGGINAKNENELDDQMLDSVSGGVGSKPPFKNYGKGGPVIHTTELGPKQDDPNNGGHNE